MTKLKTQLSHRCYWCDAFINTDEDYYLMDIDIKKAPTLSLDDKSRKPMCKRCYNKNPHKKEKAEPTIEMFQGDSNG